MKNGNTLTGPGPSSASAASSPPGAASVAPRTRHPGRCVATAAASAAMSACGPSGADGCPCDRISAAGRSVSFMFRSSISWADT